MVNYVLSFCKITGASKIFSRNFYLPLLKPLTPKEALRTFRITGKWLLGAKIQHYIPVLLNHRKKRSRRVKNFGKKPHHESDEYTYMSPVFDYDNENHKLLLTLLEDKQGNGVYYVYTVEDKKYNIVLQGQLERAIIDGDVIDVLVSQKNDKIIVKLKNFKKIPLEIQYFENDDAKMYCGEGATSPEEEKFHHHGKYTMSLAKIFEEKELMEEKWEEELRKLMRKRKRQAKEGSKEWKEMMQESIKNLDWEKFEEEAKRVIEEIDQPATEQQIDMEIEDLSSTRNVNETILEQGPEMLEKLPTLKEIPDIIRNMGNATLHEISCNEEIDETSGRKVSGVKVTLSSGKECFVSGQIVHTEDGDVFVPGQTVENEFGLEYAPGITININNKPTLINGLIMGEEDRDPMFLPTQSTITADGQLTFATAPEERPKPNPEKMQKRKEQEKEKMEVIDEQEQSEPESELESNDSQMEVSEILMVELDNSEIEEFDAEAMRLKKEQEKLELEKLKMILLDDGLDDILSSIEDKRLELIKKVEELRKLNVNTENLVTYVSDMDAIDVAAKISSNSQIINRLSDILLIVTRRAATFRDRNSIQTDNINHNNISVNNPTDADIKFNNASNKLKTLLKSVTVALNDTFKSRPKDQMLALHVLGEILAGCLKDDEDLLQELLDLMNTPMERNELCSAIFKQLTQNITEMKVSVLNNLANANLSSNDVINCVEKILRKEHEIECDAFVSVIKIKPELAHILTGTIKPQIMKINNEKSAIDCLKSSIELSVKSLVKSELKKAIEEKCDLVDLTQNASSFAQALCLTKEQQILENVDISQISDVSTLDLLERTILMKYLGEKDPALKSALNRLKKNPDRSRKDPRIRQLIRESTLLLPKLSPLKNSREIPSQLIKSENTLAIDDFLLQRRLNESPVLITRNSLQIVVPKEAEKNVLAGKVPYCLIDESGISNIKPLHMFSGVNIKNRDSRTDEFSNAKIRDRSVEKDANRKYLQAKTNVRKLKKLFHNNSRQVA